VIELFVDEIEISCQGGKGGNGVVAFRRELKVAMGGPAGGSGGRGGDIYFVAEEGLSTLLDLRYTKLIKGKNGESGAHKNMTGADADDTFIKVPVGSAIYNTKTGKLIADLTSHQEKFLACKGGRGGRGNTAFATGINKAPYLCELGEPGETIQVKIVLKVLADCGLVGFPSVGKSTLISAVSKAKPKIAEYHFTTIVPHLGIVGVDEDKSFVMADLPGLIEGAHQGLGLGIQFLKHIERCRVIVHVIDMSQTDGRDAYSDYLIIKDELKNYKLELEKRPVIIAANKMDLPQSKENLKKFMKQYKDDAEIIPISSYAKDNLQMLLYKISDLLDKNKVIENEEKPEIEVEYNYIPEDLSFKIIKDENYFTVELPDKYQRIYLMTDFTKEEGVKRFLRQLRSFGLDEELKNQGIENGDTVLINDFEFDYFL